MVFDHLRNQLLFPYLHEHFVLYDLYLMFYHVQRPFHVQLFYAFYVFPDLLLNHEASLSMPPFLTHIYNYISFTSTRCDTVSTIPRIAGESFLTTISFIFFKPNDFTVLF